MLYMGDNVYGDIRDDDVETLENAYIKQAQSAPLNRLRAAAPRLAIWDDHDYGLNDAGAGFRTARRPRPSSPTSGIWTRHASPDRDGIEDAWIVGPPGRRVQFILLDTRSYRSMLKESDARGVAGKERYLPDADPGGPCWARRSGPGSPRNSASLADLRILVSLDPGDRRRPRREAWRTMPGERERRSTRSQGRIARLRRGTTAHDIDWQRDCC